MAQLDIGSNQLGQHGSNPTWPNKSHLCLA